VAETGEPSKTATPERPGYGKFQHDPCVHVEASQSATSVFGIQVDEGWRSWILCSNMYEWAADQLLEVLRASDATWEPGGRRGDEPQGSTAAAR